MTNSPTSETSPLQSVHTQSFDALLKQLQVSVIVSTYQVGFLIVLRHDGTAVNTHFRRCERPMGLAASGSRLAVGAAREIVQFRNMADVASKVAGPRPHSPRLYDGKLWLAESGDGSLGVVDPHGDLADAVLKAVLPSYELSHQQQVHAAIQRGVEDMEAGRTMTIDESRRRSDEALDRFRQ